MKKKIPIIAIVGATAVGKTELSIEIAKEYNCEIISIDSVQIYKEFDIGSAKITKEEMMDVPHHLIDILNPTDKFSVYEFQKLARKKIEEIYSKGKIPLLIGGTGYYMNAVLYNYQFSNYSENNVVEDNIDYMKQYLKSNYEDTYNKLDLDNKRRIINAYKYVINEKKSTLENNLGDEIYYRYNPYVIFVDRSRENLYDRINKRVEIMLDKGLEKEVYSIVKTYGEDLQPLKSIGYKEMVSFLKGEISRDFMINLIQKNSRNYAKRQLTWFRNKIKDINYYNIENIDKKIIFDDIDLFIESVNNGNN
ncbi:tRNA (adenosine(37)-N6)-dimethylallyltransferase MiaA [Gemella sp. GH3]|uniref:tRNA (adenosine(37)-N6)-dimethylallyltransferase MiaA n=1 Tax=unclassified Gemella TaxID=2624949 RepID=UPI0015CFC37C|nr:MULTISPECIES: tRNA (adenosine(37)-N6)-dimethylallyltransferase MiaA [unclassified Gemella]MBF0714333.1 tRNA (adenosine(37)-N6)-dimethylallyltransferase MiaA [Gemella sp. GH3.1]NYS51285.1 tRNA (adenosine(37)-N6)-dimethylallyltransferase MiaA [Gemella sp. GH3]